MTERSPLGTTEVFEAAAFRVSRVVRRLLAEHPGLPLKEIRPSARADGFGGTRSAQVELDPREVDGVRAWAEALGAEVQVKFYDTTAGCPAFESHKATVEVDGVEVEIACTRSLSDDEAQTWRTGQDLANAGEPGGQSGGAR
ncbi:hypothetical protein HW130_17295 [Streptomyces sp. PKU-EA00015]|nr:hypothetical protein [Streptomyces sp. PKU-EA00015]